MIYGKVARILSEKEVVLNVGLADGVKEGDVFVIFSEGERIIDPETGEDLGPLENVKGRVTVSHVMEKMSRAKTSTYQQTQSGTLTSAYSIASSMLGGGTVTRHRKLPVQEKDIRSVSEEKHIVTGDSVHSIESI